MRQYQTTARPTTSPRWRTSAVVLGWAAGMLAIGAAPRRADAQTRAPQLELGSALLPDGEESRYLRALHRLDPENRALVGVQAAGAGFDAAWRAILRREASHPWAGRARLAGPAPLVTLLRPAISLLHQSGLVTADVPGVTWAGLGVTTTAQLGLSAQWRFVRAQLAPVVFWTENDDFTLTRNLRAGPLQFGDARFPLDIDLPQRFGADPYGRFDWGDSFLELSAFRAVIGVSNARQHWGPAQRYPLSLGVGSGGFGHGYVGTSEPVDIGIGRIHGRLILGRVEQSPYSVVQSGQTARFLSAAVATFSPRALPSLEIGGTRLVNGPWPDGGAGWAEAMLPFGAIINDNVSSVNLNPNNGFASVFLRIAPPGSGLEGYVELSRDDFAGNVRWLILEPDDLAQLTIGMGHSWRRTDGTLRRLAIELTNGELAHTERAARTLQQPLPPYINTTTPQGLTNRGQLLGSLATYSGAGATAVLEYFTARGRTTWAAERVTVLDWTPALGPTGGVSTPEVRYGLRAEVMRFRGEHDIGASLAPSYTFNRSLRTGDDRWALELGVQWRGW